MLFKLLNKIDHKYPFERATAHCDIPCKIYDPISAQLAVLTMIRMVDLLTELKENTSLGFEKMATFTRLINEKEVHGNKVKTEVHIIWGDYIKQAQLDKYPELHTLTHEIMLATSYAKQHVDRDACVSLLEKVNTFAEIFWQSKGVAVFRVKCPYPISEVLVYPDLKPT